MSTVVSLNDKLTYDPQNSFFYISEEGDSRFRSRAETPEQILLAKKQMITRFYENIGNKLPNSVFLRREHKILPYVKEGCGFVDFISSSVDIDASLLSEKHFLFSSYLDLLSNAYSSHLSITIAPHDFWYIILTDIAGIVRDNVEECRPLYSSSNSKIEILIDTNDVTKINLLSLVSELIPLVPTDISIFNPSFTTHTKNSELACLASFCDAASHYYSYMTFCCGIPAIKVDGTEEDWENVYEHTIKLVDLFKTVNIDLSEWLRDRVGPIVENILKTISGQDMTDFWKNIFTQQNVGSGGELDIDGWFKTLFYKDHGKRITNFPKTWSIVPYKNIDTGRSFSGIHGCFVGKMNEEGFVSTEYGEIVFETLSVPDGVIVGDWNAKNPNPWYQDK